MNIFNFIYNIEPIHNIVYCMDDSTEISENSKTYRLKNFKHDLIKVNKSIVKLID